MGRKDNGALWRRLRAQVQARDAPCHLCGQPIDYHLPAGQPGSYEVDHITPYSIAPHLQYTLSNLAAAHRLCNQRKSNGRHHKKHTKPPEKPVKPTMSRDW